MLLRLYSDGDGETNFAATTRIRNGWMKFRELVPFLTSRAPLLEMKGRVYYICVRSSLLYGSETRPFLSDIGLKFERAEMQVIRWMCRVSMKDRKTSEKLRNLVSLQPSTTVIRSGRLRWYGHVTRKNYEDWVKKCMEIRSEGRIPLGRPIIGLECVEADMAELEIDRDVHDMKRKCNPTRNRNINQ